MSKTYILSFLSLFFLAACATYAPQVRNTVESLPSSENRPISKTIYLFGDGGYIDDNQSTEALKAFELFTQNENKANKLALFLGDNIYPKGLPKKDHPKRQNAEYTLEKQHQTVVNQAEKIIFIPGNHDWYDSGVKGLKRQEDFINKLDNTKFFPQNGCPIESIELTDDVQLIIVDSQWYLWDWDKEPTINKDCEIKTRKRFFEEITSEMKRNGQKTVLFAIHHPLITNGIHGGKHHIKKHLFPSKSDLPLPVLSSLVLQLRTPGGLIVQDKANKRYTELVQRLEILTKDHPRLVFLSGHEHNLQYLEERSIKQIVSGSTSKESFGSLSNNGLFSYGGQGFGVLDIFEDGGVNLRFVGAENETPTVLFEKQILPPEKLNQYTTLPEKFPKTVQASVYDDSLTTRSAFFKTLWGAHYRSIYSTKVEAPVALLDTLYGGLKPVRSGGGFQTNTLRLEDKDGKDYNMRSLRKDALQLIQKSVLREVDVQDDFKNTFVEDIILDFYTAAHPYAAFVIPDLSDAIGVLHTNPKLFYVPKQKALGVFNENYGDELYMIVERPHGAYEGKEIFDFADEIRGTDELFEQIQNNEKNRIDEAAFIRARLFDMILGDWDRHLDQWRWAEFKDQDGKDIFLPIPRDRDQVFANFDGSLFNVFRSLASISRIYNAYDGDLTKNDLQWLNYTGSRLDRVLIKNATEQDWLVQARHIQENLTDEVIDNAFKKMPLAVQNEISEDIKQKLKNLRDKLQTIAGDYYNWMSQLQIVMATNKDDFIDITRFENGSTQIQVFRNKKGNREDLMVDRVYLPEETKEIWVYGLDDDDVFTVTGNAKNPILICLIGGHGNDIYNIQEGRRIKVYDWKSLPNTLQNKGGASFTLEDDYDNNTFDIHKSINNLTVLLPKIGYNPDDGVLLGLSASFINKGFKRNPNTTSHSFSGGYYFATQGFDLNYLGTFAKVVGKWNLEVGAHFTSPNFSQNFFGFGNDTENNDDDLGLDFNRARTSQFGANLALAQTNNYGFNYYIKTAFNSVEIENSTDRFINTTAIDVEVAKEFLHLESGLRYENFNNKTNPSQGMVFDFQLGLTGNTDNLDDPFGYLNSSLEFYNPLSADKKLVLHSKMATQLRFGNNFEFYQAAQLGANSGLRAFRNERFTGKNSLVTGGDLRYSFNTIRTGFLPMQLGILGGYDGGKVWIPGEDSSTWHNSYGGGIFVNLAERLAGSFGLFNGDEGVRFSFLMTVGF
ncbi:MAG: metallophosphoesterase [Flavobacteriaceae bacterium]